MSAGRVRLAVGDLVRTAEPHGTWTSPGVWGVRAVAVGHGTQNASTTQTYPKPRHVVG
jgi:hypothetical protein